LGATDFRAAEGKEGVGLGPIAQAAASRSFREIVLLNTWGQEIADEYVRWLREKAPSAITIHNAPLSRPTAFGEIYPAASAIVSAKVNEYGADTGLVFHLSPGTPAMAAIWVLMAKTLYPAELIESSKEHGVQTVSIPFDISADFIPELLEKSDKRLARLASGLPETAPEFEDIVHRSEGMRRVVLKARKIAPRNIPVLIEGESGTGKELLARSIHDASPRKERPFIAINCGAIPKELMESELFGHEKGAFSGAVTSRVGHFEAAHSGTLFLDEVGELPTDMQVKLLRALQEGEIKRIGANTGRKLDIRIIAATNKLLIDEVAAGTFREDLFYRLAVGVIKLPPLRERPGDVGLLLDHFLERINAEYGAEPGFGNKKFSVPARNLLLQHSWPGNIRELQNTLTRATVWSAGETLDAEDIREALLPVPTAPECAETILHRPLGNGLDLRGVLKTVAVHYLERGLAQTGGNKTRAAEILGLPNYQTLTNWLRKYGLE
jgi:transcriptional regulator with PAS, ATPase and Fis domain